MMDRLQLEGDVGLARGRAMSMINHASLIQRRLNAMHSEEGEAVDHADIMGGEQDDVDDNAIPMRVNSHTALSTCRELFSNPRKARTGDHRIKRT